MTTLLQALAGACLGWLVWRLSPRRWRGEDRTNPGEPDTKA